MAASVTPTPTPIVPAQPVAVTTDLLVSFLIGIVIALAIIMLALVIGRLARAATLRALGRTRADPSTRLLIGRAVFVGVMVIGSLAALGALGVPWPTVVALAGVLGLAASLALQDVLKNFVAGVYLLVERPFRIGESIKVKEFSGAVETIDVRTTVLRTPEGDAVMVPNAILFAEIILNRGIPRPPAPPEPEEPERV
jgi:small-conductance mechanosensitive channel